MSGVKYEMSCNFQITDRPSNNDNEFQKKRRRQKNNTKTQRFSHALEFKHANLPDEQFTRSFRENARAK